MKIRLFGYMLSAVIALPATLPAAEPIRASLSVADAEVTTRVGDKQVLVPTDLEYAIEIATSCEPGSVPASLSIGVADTRHHLSLTDSFDSGRVSTTFVVPGQQLAPIVTSGYCVADHPGSQGIVIIEAAFTAQISLACRSDVASTMHYLSQPLSVRLVCRSDDESQDASSDSAR